jgi:exonuclease VII large subunit
MSRWPKRLGALLLLALAASLLLLACGDDDDDDGDSASTSTSTPDAASSEVASANADFCQNLDNFRQTLASALSNSGDSSNTTVGDVRSMFDQLRSDWQAVNDSADELDSSVRSDLQDAYDNLRSAIDDIDDNTSLQEAQTQVQEQRTEVDRAWDQAAAAGSCS